MEAQVTRLCRAEDLYVFAAASGNHNPLHLPRDEGDKNAAPQAVAPSLWIGALISAVIGNHLPGPGTLYRKQTLSFLGRAHAGDQLTAKVKLLTKDADRLVRLKTWVTHADGTLLAEGEAEVIAPDAAQSFAAEEMPGLTVQHHIHFDALLEKAGPLDPLVTAVIAPEADDALAGPLLAHEEGLITPILIGDESKIRAAAEATGRSLNGVALHHEPDHDAASAQAVKLVLQGQVQALMKGHLHTDILLKHVVQKTGGLRTNRRLSHIFVLDVPGNDRLLMVSDAAININPDLVTKVDIVQNAIDLAHALGLEQPKVGILSAVEKVNPAISSTLDAAALAKMADRGQIKGGLVDGPLAMDNAVDLAAAKTKGIKSLVAGLADILITPNLEAGNMLAKELIFVANAEAGGLVMGAKCPIILTSRADDDRSRLASCALAVLYQNWVSQT